ncbi:tRNA 2-selenouridine synthase [Campylobacter concisus]|uniref:tRNA 2-selenouridine synthase n=1 Tax=Campylobacter concisus TaxID=199 RepID=A0A7S9RG18_9BACT|nr:tRNA 2-selenouridine synthase [Campylobacter concisus]QPH91108.1 tRNA 2-selenouridine synthase [Campylobacter concisus]
MKFIGIILLLLTSIFLIACSANQASNNASNSEIKELGKKYGGVYIFNRKFYDEIEKREAERKELRKNTKGKDLGGGLYAVNTKVIDEKLPQILSNGKQYYTSWIDYERQTKKTLPNIDAFYENKIKHITGQRGYEYATVLPLYLYIDDNEQPKYISISVGYDFEVTKYGLYGDEGRGFSLSRKETRYVKGGNKFYIEDLER